MSAHLTYLEAVVTGLIQGVTELFPISSLGHNVLFPALVGGNWASALSVTAPNSPYLAFIVGLHVATAIALIAYFWRDWLRIVRGFFTSLRTRSVRTPDERLAWMIILATIPVGLVGVALQSEVTKVFAKAELAAVFLALNGVVLLVSERMRRARDSAGARAAARAAAGTAVGNAAPTVVLPARESVPSGPVPGGPPRGPAGPAGPGGPGRTGGPWPGGYSQPQFHPNPQGGQPGYGQPDPWVGQPEYGPDQPNGHGRQDAGGLRDPRSPGAWRGQRQPAGRHSHTAGHTAGHAAAHAAGHAGRPGPSGRPARVDGGIGAGEAVVADQRLSTMGYMRAVFIGAAQILALMPGISRDGIVTVAGMGRGLTRQDAVRFSFLLSAPVILAAGVLKLKDLVGPESRGMHGPILVGALISGICAYLCVRFLMRYFSEDKSLNPFGIYCLIAGIGSLAYLVLR